MCDMRRVCNKKGFCPTELWICCLTLVVLVTFPGAMNKAAVSHLCCLKVFFPHLTVQTPNPPKLTDSPEFKF